MKLRPVRCTTHKPSPYLQRCWPDLLGMRQLDADGPDNIKVIDLGGGNGRNTIFLQSVGVRYCTIVDREGDYGVQWDFEDAATLPFKSGYADVILVNYVFMLLTQEAQHRLVREITRILKPGGRVMVEVQWLPGNKQCCIHSPSAAKRYTTDLIHLFSWPTLKAESYRFIAQKPLE
jgi:ubiquinone/menaquinone biosynthesis C-methylase UbiE